MKVYHPLYQLSFRCTGLVGCTSTKASNPWYITHQGVEHMFIFQPVQVSPLMEVCYVPATAVASQYRGLYLFTGVSRMMRPVLNLSLNVIEFIGTFEQVYLSVCVTPKEAYEGVGDIRKCVVVPSPYWFTIFLKRALRYQCLGTEVCVTKRRVL